MMPGGWLLTWTLGCLDRPPEPSCAGAETWLAEADDGAELHLHRHPAEGPAVLVVHGISSNHRCWDLSPERSLASYLQEAGWDAWLLDLRGHGHSPRSAPQDLDTYARRDLPAAMDRVLALTGQQQLHYVGHSMGGMLAGMALASIPELRASVASLTVVGSPIDFSDPDPALLTLIPSGSLASQALGQLPSPLGARLQSVLPSNPIPVDQMLFQDLAEEEVRQAMYQRVVSPLHEQELEQLQQMLRAGEWVDRQGRFHYLPGLEDVTVPTLVLAGRGDLIAPPDRVLGWASRLPLAPTRLLIAGVAEGFSADYGHLDLTLGDHAREEIFPEIVSWMEAHPSADSAEQSSD